MNRCHLLAAVVATAVVAGCASADQEVAAQEDDETYVTGSRLPVRTGSGPGATKATTTLPRIDDMLRRPGNATGGVPGAGGN